MCYQWDIDAFANLTAALDLWRRLPSPPSPMNPELARLVIAFLEGEEHGEERLMEWFNQHGPVQVKTRVGCFEAVLGIIPRLSAFELACDFAEHVLPIFEHYHPNDRRPRTAVEIRRRWARAEVNDEDWLTAWRAAGAAVQEASAAWLVDHPLPPGPAALAAWAACGGCALSCADDAACQAAATACSAAGRAAAVDKKGVEMMRLVPAMAEEQNWQLQRLREMLLL